MGGTRKIGTEQLSRVFEARLVKRSGSLSEQMVADRYGEVTEKGVGEGGRVCVCMAAY